MKLISSYAFVLLLFLITIGSNWFFTTKQQRIRQEMKMKIKAGVPSDQLFYFRSTSPETDFHWIKPAKEFEFKNQLFDVVTKKKLEDGSFELACVNDVQEQILFTQLELLTHKNKGNQNFYILFSSPIYFIFSDEFESIQQELITVSIPSQKKYGHFEQKYTTHYHFSIEIPPEYVLSV